MSRKKLLESLECCVQYDACDRCPMMEEICDYPFVPFTQLPVPLVVAVMEELKGDGGETDDQFSQNAVSD